MLRPLFLCALLWAAPAPAPASADPPSAALGFDPFYTQQIEAVGIPVIASSQTPPAALKRAARIVTAMLAYRPDLAAELVRQRTRIAIMAETEAITDLPEMAHWTKPAPDDPRLTRCERKHYAQRIGALTDREYWNARVRGIGGTHTVAAAEDVLGLPSSRYWGETILVHEFAHDVLAAIRTVDPALEQEVQAAYAAAQANGRWTGEYALTTVDEYWAEGTQFWFDSNRLAVMDGYRVLNHADLAAYDPPLYAALARAYGAAHHLPGDPFWMAKARVPPGPPPRNTAEVC